MANLTYLVAIVARVDGAVVEMSARQVDLSVWRIRQFRAFFFRPDTRESTSPVAKAEFAVIETVAVTGTFSRASSLLAIAAVAHGVSLSGWALIGLGKVAQSRPQMANEIVVIVC